MVLQRSLLNIPQCNLLRLVFLDKSSKLVTHLLSGWSPDLDSLHKPVDVLEGVELIMGFCDQSFYLLKSAYEILYLVQSFDVLVHDHL